MVKFVLSMAHELARTKETLQRAEKELLLYKNENELLKKELSRIQQSQCALGMPSPPASVISSIEAPEMQLGEIRPQTTSLSSETATQSSPVVAQYLKPTKASTAKIAKSATLASKKPILSPTRAKITFQNPSSEWAPTRDFTGSILPELLEYKDGKLVKKVHSFMRPTRATADKAKPTQQHTPYRKGGQWLVEDWSDGQEGWGEPEHHEQPESRTPSDDMDAYVRASPDAGRRVVNRAPGLTSTRRWLHTLDFHQAPHTMSDKTCKDIIDLHVLPLKTRLEGTSNDWLQSSLGAVRVNDEFQFRLLLRAREIAQKCYWHFMDANQPEVRERDYRGGWQQVRFEGLVMDRQLGGSGSGHDVLALRQNTPSMVRNTVFDVIQLRHQVSHYHPNDGIVAMNPRYVDRFLKDAQKLAIHLYDEGRALEIRGLRDELREAAEDALREVELLEHLAALPFAGYPWSYHHECMFADIWRGMDGDLSDLSKFPDAVVRVALDWDITRYGTKYEPPVWDWDVHEEERPEKEMANVSVRRHSISSSQASFQLGGVRFLARRRASIDLG